MKLESFRNRCVLGIILLAALVSGPARAEQTLADADWFTRELADGVVWRYFLFDNLFGARQSVSYLEVNLNHPDVSVEIPFVATGRQRTSSMILAQFPDAVGGINGTYFNTATEGGHRTYLRVNNTVIPPGSDLFSAWGYEGALALDTAGNASIESKPSGGWNNDTLHPDIIACGPLLIVANVIPSARLTAIGSHCTSRHPRTAAGLTADNRLILITVDGRTEMAAGMSCEELAQTMDQLGCVDALNYDGGGSTTLWGAGEPFNGVLNYPSDNSLYDHGGERSCANAIAVIAPATGPAQWDGRLVGKSFSMTMGTGSEQTVTLTYQNIGTQTWSATETQLALARPVSRNSVFYDPASWPAPWQPAAMTPATVEPGQTAAFTFPLKAPEVETIAVYNEHFMLTQAGVGRIGPADSEAWMKIIVEPPPSGAASFLVESRAGGQNYSWYSDSGMADTAANCTAPGATGTIGMRYGSTYRSVAGVKHATAAPNFPGAGEYKVYVAWGNGASRRGPITYHVNHARGKDTFLIDQTPVANVWIQLGTGPFYFDRGYGGSVTMTNETTDVSGSMYAGAVKFEYVSQDATNWEVR